jgi:hypothetical protein
MRRIFGFGMGFLLARGKVGKDEGVLDQVLDGREGRTGTFSIRGSIESRVRTKRFWIKFSGGRGKQKGAGEGELMDN